MRSALHAQNLAKCRHYLDKIGLRRHHGIDRFIRHRRLVDDVLVLAALSRFRSSYVPCLSGCHHSKATLRDRAATVLVAVVAVMVLVLTLRNLAALVAGLMSCAKKTLAVARAITGNARRPRIRWIFAIADSPLDAADDPAV
jgi:hypothetical protein